MLDILFYFSFSCRYCYMQHKTRASVSCRRETARCSVLVRNVTHRNAQFSLQKSTHCRQRLAIKHSSVFYSGFKWPWMTLYRLQCLNLKE